MDIERHSQVSESIEKIENSSSVSMVDYSSMSLEELLSPETIDNITERERDVRNFYDAHKLEKIRLGQYFSYLKLKEKHGQFENTCKLKFPNISSRTIRRYMKAFIDKDKVLNKIVNNKEVKEIKKKKERGEKTTPSEERALIIYNTASLIKKVMTLISTHGVEETFENYIPEEKKESLQKDIITISTSEMDKLQVTLQKKEKETEKTKLKLSKLNRETKIIRKQIKEKEELKTQLLLEFDPKKGEV